MPLLKIGSKVDKKYEVQEFLGEGPWGEEYRAVRLEDQRLAVVVVPTRFKNHAEILGETARALRGVVHKNLVEILDVGYVDPTKTMVYWAREWVEGMDLGTLVQKRFPLGAQLGFVRRFVYHLGAFLRDAHRSFYHGHLSPRMVWLTYVGRIKVAEPGFFVALRQKVPSVSILTDEERPFIAPELRGRGAGSPRSDTYSFGALVHLLLTGKAPGLEGDLMLKPGVPPRVVQLLEAALSLEPSDRPDAATFADELHSVLSEVPERAQVSSVMMDLLHSFEGSDTGRKYMVQKDRLDYGPYTAQQIRELVVEESVLPEHLVVSLDTGERYRLAEHPDFAEFVREYLRKKELERREKAEQQVKEEERRQSRILKLSALLGGAVVLAVLASFLLYRAVGGGSEHKRKALQLVETDIEVTQDDGVGKRIRVKKRRHRRRRRSSSGGTTGMKIGTYTIGAEQLSKYEVLGVINSSGVIQKIAANCGLPPKGRIVISYQISGPKGRVVYVSATVDGRTNKKIARCAYRYLRKLKFRRVSSELGASGRIVY